MSLTDIIAKLTGEKIMPLKKGYSKKSVSYNIKKEMVSFDGTVNHDPALGSYFVEDILTATLVNLSNEKNVELKLLAGKPLFIIVQDLNDVYHAFGVQSGAEKVGSTRSSGREYGTMNGYTMYWMLMETELVQLGWFMV